MKIIGSDIAVYVKRRLWFRKKLQYEKDYNVEGGTLILKKAPSHKCRLQVYFLTKKEK